MKIELTNNEVATLELLIIEEMQVIENRIAFRNKNSETPYITYLKNKLAELKAVKSKLSGSEK